MNLVLMATNLIFEIYMYNAGRYLNEYYIQMQAIANPITMYECSFLLSSTSYILAIHSEIMSVYYILTLIYAKEHFIVCIILFTM